jgi:hypothetical protein
MHDFASYVQKFGQLVVQPQDVGACGIHQEDSAGF